MPKGRKRTQADYEREIEEAAKRIKKHREGLEAARDSQDFLDFLDSIGITTIDSSAGQDFWENVRQKMPAVVRQAERRKSYGELREIGVPAKIARRVRDWSEERQQEFIENWQARY